MKYLIQTYISAHGSTDFPSASLKYLITVDYTCEPKISCNLSLCYEYGILNSEQMTIMKIQYRLVLYIYIVVVLLLKEITQSNFDKS